MGDDTLAKMEFPHKLVLAIALISCLAVSMPADSIVAEEDHAPQTTLLVLDQVRHLPADEIVAFLQKDESACRSVAGSLQTEVKRVIGADETAYRALDTGVNCPNELQSNTNTAQTAYNNAKAAVKSAEEAKTAADSAPVKMTITFTKTPSVSTLTSNSHWQKAVTTAKNAENALLKKQGELKQAGKTLDAAKSAQAKAVLACQCKAKKAFGAAVSNAKKHETSSKEDWRKSERLLCALKKQEPCPSNFPGFAKPPALPTAVSSKTKDQCRPPAPPPPPPPRWRQVTRKMCPNNAPGDGWLWQGWASVPTCKQRCDENKLCGYIITWGGQCVMYKKTTSKGKNCVFAYKWNSDGKSVQGWIPYTNTK